MQICPNVAAACMARFATPPPMAAQRPAPLGPFTPWERFSCTIPQQRETAMATSAERMWALRERQRRGLRKLRIEVSEDDLRQIAKRGYERAVTIDHDQRAQAVGLFLSDVLLQI
jgi:hypothetical protein